LSFSKNEVLAYLKLHPKYIFMVLSNPEGLVANQTTIVKGAGSALLDHILQRYKVGIPVPNRY
jgi:hypothetical protein